MRPQNCHFLLLPIFSNVKKSLILACFSSPTTGAHGGQTNEQSKRIVADLGQMAIIGCLEIKMQEIVADTGNKPYYFGFGERASQKLTFFLYFQIEIMSKNGYLYPIF